MSDSSFLWLLCTQMWQIALLTLIVAVVVRLLSSRHGRLAYWMWLLVVIKCVTPPIWGHPLGLFSQIQTVLGLPLAGPAEPATQSSSHPPVVIDGGGTLASLALSSETEFLSENSATGVLFAESPAADSERIVEGEAVSGSGSPWRVVFWLLLCGMIVSVCVITLQFVRCVRRIFARRVTKYDDDVGALVMALAKQLKLRRVPRVIVSDVHFGPAVMGVFRHLIVLPECLLDAAIAGDVGHECHEAAPMDGQFANFLRPILAHEMLHIRRGDLWTGALQAIVQCLWWFHPVVWMVNRVLSRETERCCDEQVVAELGCSPLEYAQSVLSVIECKHQLKSVPVFPGMKPVEITTQRMERIMSLKQGSQKRMSWWNVVAVVLFAAVVLPGEVTGQEDKLNGKMSVPRSHSLPGKVMPAPVYQSGVSPTSVVADANTELSGQAIVATVNDRAISVDNIAGDVRLKLEAESELSTEQRQGRLRSEIKSRLAQFVEQEIVLQEIDSTLTMDKSVAMEKSLFKCFFKEVLPGVRLGRGVETDAELEEMLAKDGLSIEVLLNNFSRMQKVQGYVSSLVDHPASKEDLQAAIDAVCAKASVVTLFDEGKIGSSTTTQPLVSDTGVQGVSTASVADSRQAGSGDAVGNDTGRGIIGEAKIEGMLNRITVVGAVKQPGAYSIQSAGAGVSVLHAIALAGGLQDSADERVVVRRPLADGSVSVNLVSLRSVGMDARSSLTLGPGDVVVVERNQVRDVEKKLQQKLQQIVTLTFDDIPILDAVKKIATTYGVNIVLDTRAIETAASSKTTPVHSQTVSIDVKDITLRGALTLLCNQLSWKFETDHHEVIRISPERWTPRVYNVADLVVPIGQSVPSPGSPATGSPEPSQPKFAEVMELITTTIEPSTWSDQGGGGRINQTPNTLSLVVRQTDGVHKQIVELLSQLRDVQNVQLATVFRVEQFSTPEQLKWLEQNIVFKRRPRGHSWALLPMDTNVDRTPKAGEQGTRLSVSKMTTFVGQTGTLEVTSDANRTLHLLSAAERLSGDKLLRLTYAASCRTDARTKPLQPQITQVVGNGQTLLLDVTEMTRPGAFAAFPDPRLSKAEQATDERTSREKEKLAERIRGRVIVAITPSIVHPAVEKISLPRGP